MAGRGYNRPAPVANKFHNSDSPIPAPDPIVGKTEDDFIKKASSGLTLSGLSLNAQFPLRPAHGSQGTPVVVYANYVVVNPVEDLSFYQYHVTIVALSGAPTASKAKTKRLVEILLEDHVQFKGATSDFGTQLVSQRKITGLPDDYDIAYRAECEDSPPSKPSMYRLSVSEGRTVSPGELLSDLRMTDPNSPKYPNRAETIQCINIVLGHNPQFRLDISTIGQNKYYSINPSLRNQTSLSPGVLALRGFFKSVRPATSRLLLNVNVSHTACYEPMNLAGLMRKFGLHDKVGLGRLLRLLRVDREHLAQRKNSKNVPIPRLATIWDLATTNDGQTKQNGPRVKVNGAGPKDVHFWLNPPQPTEAGRYISVYDYFFDNYRTKMALDLPVVNTGSRENPRYLPAEVCQVIPGQPYGKKLDVSQTRNMIRFACRKPNENADSIVGIANGDGREVLGLNSDPDNTLAKNGISVGTSLITVNARILPAPEILYGVGGANRKISPRFGSWNLESTVFCKICPIKNWGFVRLVDGGPAGRGLKLIDVDKAVTRFREHIRKTGIVLPPPKIKSIMLSYGAQENVAKIDEMIKLASDAPEALKPEFIVFVLPRNDSFLYNKIKSLGDVTYGMQTICVVEEKFALLERKDQYFANVGLKINLKAGGINQTLNPAKLGIISEGHTMVVGIDVTHPSPGSKSTAPSVAGMVASVDRQLGQWPAELRIQEKKKEMVTEIGEMLKTRLLRWQRSNGQLPRNILIYRDGVSEGQYSIVLDQELRLLRIACTETYPSGSSPNISIIIVGKRHHTRFYPTDDSNADRSANCRNGTVVDRGVTEVRDWHFYLQAHACLQGTARPAHYFVILDEIFRARCKSAPGGFQVPKAHQKGNQNRNAADDLEQLTHNMCHLFGRATKAVSICPPAYYADLLCERARCYLSHHFDPAPGNSPGGAPAAPKADEIRVHDRLKDTMFYI